jgi:hypothetical protein
MALKRLNASQVDRNVHISTAVAVVGQVDNPQSRRITCWFNAGSLRVHSPGPEVPE